LKIETGTIRGVAIKQQYVLITHNNNPTFYKTMKKKIEAIDN